MESANISKNIEKTYIASIERQKEKQTEKQNLEKIRMGRAIYETGTWFYRQLRGCLYKESANEDMGCLFTYFQNMARKGNRGANIFETLPLDGSNLCTLCFIASYSAFSIIFLRRIKYSTFISSGHFCSIF